MTHAEYESVMQALRSEEADKLLSSETSLKALAHADLLLTEAIEIIKQSAQLTACLRALQSYQETSANA